MTTKKCFICGLGFVIGLLSLISIITLITELEAPSEPINLFEMSLEELMEIEITTISQKEANAFEILQSDNLFSSDFSYNYPSVL